MTGSATAMSMHGRAEAQEAGASEWIDITTPLRAGMPHWPGEPAFERKERPPSPDSGSVTSVLTLGTHTGTHVDAPRHFLPGGAAVDEAPWDALIGPAVVVEHRGPAIEARDVDLWALAPGMRLVIQTDNSRRPAQQRPPHADIVGLTPAAAAGLAAAQVRLVGIDGLSVAQVGHAKAVHEALLGGGCWIVEGLDLSAVRPGLHELLCLPLRIAGGDGAPARALLRPAR